MRLVCLSVALDGATLGPDDPLVHRPLDDTVDHCLGCSKVRIDPINPEGEQMAAPAAPAPPRERVSTDPRVAGLEHHNAKPRWATAADTSDPYCHWYLNRSRTLCGITHSEPLPRSSMHKEAPCPNGNPPCPACVQAYRG